MKHLSATAAAIATLAFAGSAGAATYVGAGGPLPDLVVFNSGIVVSDTFQVSDVNVTLEGLQHTFWADLDIYLINGDISIALVNEAGGSSDPNGDFTFDDQAALDLTSLNTTGGVFRPLEALSAFNGRSAAGTWTLRIVDDAGADAGQLGAWKLTLSGAPSPGGVPEPSTWAMMIAGFGLAGAAMRRRRTALA
ncbi:MAG: PEPxxWA-CTERM sorting domain-containing protein [Pseudomonadota bacterium]